jgi:hypothetical protein
MRLAELNAMDIKPDPKKISVVASSLAPYSSQLAPIINPYPM